MKIKACTHLIDIHLFDAYLVDKYFVDTYLVDCSSMLESHVTLLHLQVIVIEEKNADGTWPRKTNV